MSSRRRQVKTPSIRPAYGSPISVPSLAAGDVKLKDDDHRCWTCRQQGSLCDMALPVCNTCLTHARACRGYGLRVHWPTVGVTPEFRHSKARFPLASHQLSQLGLPSQQSFYMQHLSKNLARIALAVDYEGNGYRKWIQVAASDSLLLDAMLAVTISHYSRWKHQQCVGESRKHYNRTIKQLRSRLQDPVAVRSETTLATMLFLISYEVFDGSNRWKEHHAGMLSWISVFGSQAPVDSFLKSWVSMINTQCALNTGIPVAPEVEAWLVASSTRRDSSVIDPFFGCSASMPSLMLEASNLYIAYRTASISNKSADESTRNKAMCLQENLTKQSASSAVPTFEMTWANEGETLSPVHYFPQKEIFTRAAAVAEIFRYSLLVYVLRILHPPSPTPIPEIQEAVQSVLELLPLVPDVVGPGSNLGWAFVVIGIELEEEQVRQYIWGRLQGLRSLAFGNVESAEKILKAGWRNRDEARQGRGRCRHWQDLMQSLDVEQILI